MNMVGLAQVNQTGTGVDAKASVDTKKKKGTYKSAMWQHNTLPLVFAAWVDNALLLSF